MIIHDFDVQGIPIVPLEANPPLVVDANTMLSAPIAAQSFQAIGRRHAQILQCLRTIQHPQLAQRNLLNIGRQPARPLAIEDFLRLGILEIANHMRSLYRLALNAKMTG